MHVSSTPNTNLVWLSMARSSVGAAFAKRKRSVLELDLETQEQVLFLIPSSACDLIQKFTVYFPVTVFIMDFIMFTGPIETISPLKKH